MKRQMLGMLAGIIAASALIAAQGSTATQPQTKAAADVTVTGCLTQGSGPAVFVLNGAKQRADDKTEKAQSYVVIAAAEDLPLAANLNHEVSVMGSPNAKVMTPPPAGEKVMEKDLPRFSAKSVTLVADRCTSTR